MKQHCSHQDIIIHLFENQYCWLSTKSRKCSIVIRPFFSRERDLGLRLSHHWDWLSPVPRPSCKAERGSGVLSNISCHIGQSLNYGIKNVIITFYIRDWVFWQLGLLHGMVYKSLIGREVSWESWEWGKFFLPPIRFKTTIAYVMHI